MPKTISRDEPLAEITLRKYEKPDKFRGRELTRKLCLSLGLLQPGDSRDIIVDILSVVLRERKELTSEEIEALVIKERADNKLPQAGIASSNIRRQLKRLKDIFILEAVNNAYRISENASLEEIFSEKIEKYLLGSIKERVREYIRQIDGV